MKHFLRCNPEDGQAIELAIETVGRANDDALTAQLVEFLMGDTDGVPKVSVVHMCLGLGWVLTFCFYVWVGEEGEGGSTLRTKNCM